jgi:tetratricopeptide (TPR) repeat protein
MAAFGLGFGLLAVMIQSASDFGQHLPANFCLTAIVCGLLVSIGRIERRYDGDSATPTRLASEGASTPTRRASEGPSTPTRRASEDPSLARRASGRRIGHPSYMPGRGRWLAGAMALCGLAALWGWVLWEANAARLAAEHWQWASMAASRASQWNWQVGDEDYKDLIASAAAAADCEPDKVKPRYWLNFFRWHSISRVVDAKTGQVIWHPQSVRFAQRIAEELSQARVLCPTFGPLYSFEGQLRLLFLGEAGGGELIRKGYELAPNDAAACFTAGILALREDQLDEAATRFKRAIALEGFAYSKDSFFSQIVHIYVDELGRPELVRGLVTEKPREGVPAEDVPPVELLPKDRLLRDQFFKTRCRQWQTIIEILTATEEDACLAAEIRHETAAMLRRRCQAEDVTVDELAALADICRDSGQYAEAADCYRRALGFNFDQVQWRAALAQCLADLGDAEEADHQARVCLRLSPGMDAAVKLIKTLSVQGKRDEWAE